MELTSAEWSRLELDNETEYLLNLGTSPLAERGPDNRLAWVITGVDDNTYNGVAQTRLSESEADDAIPATVERFRARDLSALWYVDEHSRPFDLPDRLRAVGCRELDSGVAMGIHLSSVKCDIKAAQDVDIRRVTTAADLTRWCGVYAPDDPRREPLYASLGLDGAQPLRHVLALFDGQPAATASIFLASQSAGLYHVEVAPAFRRRGIGSAIVLAALREARDAGASVAVLGPTPESQSMYERIGFRLFTSAYRCFTI